MQTIDNLQSTRKSRNSSIELLRIISMWMIVFYHFHTHVLQYGSDAVVYRAVQIPIHIAVISFVLISGFFGINASIKGFSKLLAKILFYALFITLIVVIYGVISGKPVLYSTDYVHQFPISKGFAINSFLFVSRSPLWFIRSYLLLYMISPFLNKVLENQTKQERILLLIILGFITLWIDLLRVDGMGGGKNVLNFSFIYVVGRTIKEYDFLEKVNIKINLISYIILTLSVVALFVVFDGTAIGSAIGVLAFRYNGIICVISAILFFMLFARITLNSKIINIISVSVFAVYLIHEHPLLNTYIYSIVDAWQQHLGIVTLYAHLFVYSITIVICAAIVDNMTLPIQKGMASVISKVLTFVGRKFDLIKK